MKNNYIGFYCSDKTKKEIERNAERELLTVSAFLRKRGTENTLTINEAINMFEKALKKGFNSVLNQQTQPRLKSPADVQREKESPSTTTPPTTSQINIGMGLPADIMKELKKELAKRGKIE
jgi:hypothetical protein